MEQEQADSGIQWADSTKEASLRQAVQRKQKCDLKKMWCNSASEVNMRKELLCTLELSQMIDSGTSIRQCERPLYELFVEKCGKKEALLHSRKHLTGSKAVFSYLTIELYLIFTLFMIDKSLSFLYGAVLVFQIEEFHLADGFSVTFDIWTSRDKQHSFVCITYHWLNTEMDPKEGVFDVVNLTKNHTAGYLAVLLAKAIDSRTSPHQVLFGAVTDNGANVVKAAKLLVSQYSEILERDTEEEEDHMQIPGIHSLGSFFIFRKSSFSIIHRA